MTALGQSRRFRHVRSMSGLPQTADIAGPRRHFAFAPKADLQKRVQVSGGLEGFSPTGEPMSRLCPGDILLRAAARPVAYDLIPSKSR